MSCENRRLPDLLKSVMQHPVEGLKHSEVFRPLHWGPLIGVQSWKLKRGKHESQTVSQGLLHNHIGRGGCLRLHCYKAFDAAPSVSCTWLSVRPQDRAVGVQAPLSCWEWKVSRQRTCSSKPNFNSSDANARLNATKILWLRSCASLSPWGAGPLTLGDRSGMGNTRK